MPKALIVLTSHNRLGDTGRATGWFLEEAALPYLAFRQAGYEVDVASIAGGAAPMDPASRPKPGETAPELDHFLADRLAATAFRATRPVAEVDEHAYDIVFLAGGHGAMWDFPVCEPLARVIQTVYFNGGVIGAVCHGPAGLIEVMGRDGRPLIAGRKVAGFSNAEEQAAGLADVVPFLLEDRLKSAGAVYSAGAKFTPHVVRDGRVVTGQNPMSTAGVAREMLAAVGSD